MDYTTLASPEAVQATMAALTARGHLPELLSTASEALTRIQALIPAGASIMNGSSRTLEQIGFIPYLKDGQHGWNNLHAAILAEKDPAQQAILRAQSVVSDFYLGSAHAIAQTGEIVVASNSGSQLPHLVYTSKNIILIVGTHKITPDLSTAFERLETYVYPLEDARMKGTGASGSFISKLLIINREPSFSGRKFHILFVPEVLGF